MSHAFETRVRPRAARQSRGVPAARISPEPQAASRRGRTIEGGSVLGSDRTMFESIRIEGYRGFTVLEIENLGRVNLLVGKNNSGKTSVLEAAYILSTAGDPWTLWEILARRGERLQVASSNELRPQVELGVANLFRGHEIRHDSMFRISSSGRSRNAAFELRAVEAGAADQPEIFQAEFNPPLAPPLQLEFRGDPKPPVSQLSLTRSGGLANDPLMPRRRGPSAELGVSRLITSESLATDDLIQMWNRIVLTPAEDLIVEALRFLDPGIERIAAQPIPGRLQAAQGRGGFVVKRTGSIHPVPIGSLGDGMWRMLAMASAISHCAGGMLFIDEIDTGLHYTVMSKMWNLIYSAAKRFDVQVFATTHSYDCVYSLAQIEPGPGRESITVQRIEAGRQRPIPYDDEDIAVAASRDIEVR